jgi:glutaconate CoA-transferase subunit B
MRLVATHPGVTVAQVVENTGFELIVPDAVGTNDPPSEHELQLLREEIDPQKLYI